MKRILGLAVLAIAIAAGLWWFLLRDDPVREAAKLAKAEAAVPLDDYPKQVLWGDTHLHTQNSFDAFGFGNRLGPDAALRFARGEEVTSTTGVKARLARPLDFLVISDHSDGMGALKRLADAPGLLLTDPVMRKWHDMLNQGPKQSIRATAEIISAAAAGTLPAQMLDKESGRKATASLWADQLATLDRYDEPGKFTALAGFEYSLLPNGNNLHRVVIFRDGYDRTSQVLPFPSLDTHVEQLWDYMDRYQQATGGQVLAIPHNSNVSNGLMFELTMSDGSPMTAAYARRRAAHEPLVEATQIKGDSETLPLLSPNDEFASFGHAGWSIGNLDNSHPATDAMQGGSYVREALKRGLTIEQRLGVNPYKLGMIGSTDSHTALSTADENNFFGKHSGNEPSEHDRALVPQNLGTSEGRFGWNYLAGGYAAVWARANTRAAIFDAMMRRETYATTGPRMVVRFFAAHDFGPVDFASDWIPAAYKAGVPMGGDLADSGKAPQFIVSALKDPDGANLDRVQIVKGWIDAGGVAREKVFDVVWSDMAKRRTVGGKVPAVGDTVDRSKATYTNTIGAPALRAVWSDPEYRPGQRAFYYVRVLEIPTPRWTLYDAVRFGFTLPADAMKDAVAQERAYTSPIWLDPPEKKPAA